MNNKLVKISGVYLLALTIGTILFLGFYSRISSWGDANLIRSILPRISLPFLFLIGIYFIWSGRQLDVADRVIKIASILQLLTVPLLLFSVLLGTTICPSISIVSHRTCGMAWWIVTSVTGLAWLAGILVVIQEVLKNRLTRMAQPVLHTLYVVVGSVLMLFSIMAAGFHVIYWGESGWQELSGLLPFLTFPLFPIAGIYFLWSGIKHRKTDQYELFAVLLYVVTLILYAVGPFLREAFCGSAEGVAKVLKCVRDTFGAAGNVAPWATILAFFVLVFGWFTPKTKRGEVIPSTPMQTESITARFSSLERLFRDRRAWLIFFVLAYISGMFLIGPYIIAVPFVVPQIPSGLYKIFFPAATFQKVAPPSYLIFQITYFLIILLFFGFLRKFNRKLLYIFGISMILIVILTFAGCAQIAKTLGP